MIINNKKKILLSLSILTMIALLAIFCINQKRFDGSTVQSRELIINKEYQDLHIIFELIVEDYIICEVVGDNNEYGLVTFKPKHNGNYDLSHRSINCNDSMSGYDFLINDKWYDFYFWNREDLDYAEITRIVDGETLPSEKLELHNGHIAYSLQPDMKSTGSSVTAFYDIYGNRY